MADSYFTQASNYAKKAADEYRSTFDSTLNDLLAMSNLQKEQAKAQATSNYNNLLNQINANRASLQQSYETNARQAYVNKLLADQQTTDTLSRMNLNQSGFRMTQDTLTNNRYDASLNQLVLAQDAGERDLKTQELNALNTLNDTIAQSNLKLDLDYNSKLAALKQQISDSVNNYYNKEYDRFYNDLKYQDQLKQQELENQMKQQQIDATINKSVGSTRSSSSRTSTSSNTTNNYNFSGGGSGSGANATRSTTGTGQSSGSVANNASSGGTLKYNPPANIGKNLSNNTQYKLAVFLRENGRDANGNYSPSNANISYDKLVEFVAGLKQSGTSPNEIAYIASLFGINGANSSQSSTSSGGSKTSNKSSGSGSAFGAGQGGGGFRGETQNTDKYKSNALINANLGQPSAAVSKFQSSLNNLSSAASGVRYQSPLNSNTSTNASKFKNVLDNLKFVIKR